MCHAVMFRCVVRAHLALLFLVTIQYLHRNLGDVGRKVITISSLVFKYLCVVRAHLALLLVVLVPHLDLRGRARPLAAAALVHLLADRGPHQLGTRE